MIEQPAEKMAVAVRHWQRTEVLEAEEPFTKGQKVLRDATRNPIHGKRDRAIPYPVGMPWLPWKTWLSGMSGISVTSVERIIGPDSTILLDFMLARMTKVMDGLVVYPENMMKNLENIESPPSASAFCLPWWIKEWTARQPMCWFNETRCPSGRKGKTS